MTYNSANYTAGSTGAATQTFTLSGYSGANCSVTYTQATASSIASIAITTTGC